MPLKIRYLNGPYAGRDIDIEDDRDEVRFGRGLDADIPFPEDLTLVSHQHFGLRKEYGGYKFIINREKPVFMDGRPVLDGESLPRTAQIQLSSAEGPRLRIERVQAYGANQLKTEVLRPAEDVAGAVRAAHSRTGRNAAMVALVALGLAAAAVVGYYAWKGTQEQVVATGEAVSQTQAQLAATQGEITSLKEQVPSLKEQVDSLRNSHDFSALIEQVKGSVYLVATELPSGSLRAGGTAWVVQLPDGTKALATNAHVAEEFEDARKAENGGGRLVAVEPHAPGYRRFVITGAKKHPAYDLWAQFANAYYAKAQAGTVRNVALPVAYDVAILTVDEPQALARPLKIAPVEELESMKAGEQLLQIGYPVENVLGTDLSKPEPNSNTGAITAMTSFFLSVGEARDRQFIQHTAAGAGGSSGSAMFNEKGEVVGLHNSGNYIFITTGPGENDWERVPSAGNINYAQRADLLVELMEGRAERRTEEVYKPMWAEAEKQYSKSPEAIIQDQVTLLGQQVGGADKVEVWKTLDGEMRDQDMTHLDSMKGAWFEVDPDPGYAYLLLARAGDGRNIGIALFARADDTFIGVGTRGAFFSSYQTYFDGPLPLRVAVFDDYGGKVAEDRRPAGKVTLTVYRAPMPKQ